jgi:hypothetical protein
MLTESNDSDTEFNNIDGTNEPVDDVGSDEVTFTDSGHADNVDLSENTFGYGVNGSVVRVADSFEKVPCDDTNADDDISAGDFDDDDIYVSSSDDDDDIDVDEMQCDTADGLRNWAVQSGITLVALSALLSLLRLYHPSLPKDARTIMKTVRNVEVDQKAGGLVVSLWSIRCSKACVE